MRRRSFLAGIGAEAAVATSGCLSRVIGGGSGDTVLDPQSDQQAESDALSYPAYGEPLPTFELPAPLSGTRVHTESLERTAVVTAFFATCPAECGVLLRRLADVQAMLDERGHTDAVLFLPITFDPERDDAAALRANAEHVGADLDAGNWRYLRPSSASEAERIVEGELGIGFERTVEDRRIEGYDFVHAVVTLVANPDGVVERAYRGEVIDRERVADDAATIAAADAR